MLGIERRIQRGSKNHKFFVVFTVYLLDFQHDILLGLTNKFCPAHGENNVKTDSLHK